MHLSPILHLLMAFAYILAGLAAGRNHEHHHGLHHLHLALLYALAAGAELPPLDPAPVLLVLARLLAPVLGTLLS